MNIRNSLSEVSSSSFPFSLKIYNTGAFPNTKSPRVIWVGISGDVPDLINLQRKIENKLVPIGFKEEKKRFSAHVTLGRVREKSSSTERNILGKHIEEVAIACRFGLSDTIIVKYSKSDKRAGKQELWCGGISETGRKRRHVRCRYGCFR